MGIAFYNLKEHLRFNSYNIEKELNSEKVSDLPKVKQEGRAGSKAVARKLWFIDKKEIVTTQIPESQF